jgi:hypothetical protein
MRRLKKPRFPVEKNGAGMLRDTPLSITAWLARVTFNFAFLFYAKFFMLNFVRHLLARLNLTLSNPNFLVHYGLFLDANTFLRQWHTDFLVTPNLTSCGLSRCGSTLHY